MTFRGFLAAYEEGRDEEPTRRARGKTSRSGACRSSARVSRSRCSTPRPRATRPRPPPRYTEATLVKAMEEKGIGRPSTYAATVGHDPGPRLCPHSRQRRSIPTWLAFAVTRLLEEHFTELVDYDFTASHGGRTSTGSPMVTNGGSSGCNRFYFGDEATTGEGLKGLVDRPRRHRRAGDLDDPARGRHGRAGRTLRPLCRGDRAGGRRPLDG
ncbi:MAG: DNA topoisomerase [Dermatophilaceae bacterium]